MIFTREQVVNEVLSWIGTPYHKNGRVKGAGVDCGTLLLEVYARAGFISEEDQKKLDELIPVGGDWFEHAMEEKYMKLVLRHTNEVLRNISYATLAAKPGNIVVTHHKPSGKKWNHGGIVTRWPMLVHAIGPRVQQVDATTHAMWCFREVTVFDPWEKLAQENAQ